MKPQVPAGRMALGTCLVGMVLTVGSVAGLGQWPQWGGPERNFTCQAGRLADQWPDQGPPKVWSREIGLGHSAIVVDGDTLYTMCRRGEQDAVLAVRAADGQTLWETRYPAPPREDMTLDMGCGPHSTPLVAADRIFTIGAMVHLSCLDQKSGRILWSHDLIDELGASHLGRGYGASPLAYRDLVILNVGGTDVGVAAFKQDSGELVWKSEPLKGGYPSPILVRFNDEEHLVVALGVYRVGLDPATGRTRWKFTVDKQLAGAMSTPLWVPPDRVFLSAAYGGGSQLLRIGFHEGRYAVEQVWHDLAMKVMHGNVVRIGDHVYGSSGDFGPAFLMGVSLETGKVAWRQRGFAKATLLYADGKLIILDEEGVLALATATPEGLTVHAKAKVLEEKSWTVPTLVGTRLYLRDERTMMALELGTAGKS